MRRAGAIAGGLADAMLWVTAILGVAAIVASVVMVVIGARPVVVRSGSMEPGIPTGALAIVKQSPVESVASGDVLAMELPSGMRVLHRVIERRDTPAGVVVVTKGDANETADAEPVVLHEAYRHVATVPGVGRIAVHLRTPAAGFVAALLLLGPLALRRTNTKANADAGTGTNDRPATGVPQAA